MKYKQLSKKRQKTDVRTKIEKEPLKTEKIPLNATIYICERGKHDCISRKPEYPVFFSGELIDNRGNLKKDIFSRCRQCGKILMSKNVHIDYKNDFNKYRFISLINNKNANLFLAREQIRNQIHELSPKTFLTRVNVFRCTYNEHELIDVRCKVQVCSALGRVHEEEIPAAYCIQCDRYYILETDYKKLKEKGVIICKIVEQEYWMQDEIYNNEYNLRQESELHIIGYNVSTQENLTRSQRWRVLESIVDSKVLTKIQICSHLDWLISRNKNRPNYADAISKWAEDREHIINYKSSETIAKVPADTIIHRNNIKKD